MTNRRRLALNAEYAGAQAAYWMLLCCLIAFASAFLLPLGYSASQIGMMLAAANLAALLLQAYLSAATDRFAHITPAGVLIMLYGLTASCAAGVYLLGEKSLPHALLFTGGMAFINTALPFVTALQYEAAPRGEISFGPCRAMGSLAYAAISLILGRLLEGSGRSLLPVVGILIAAAGIGLIPAIRKTAEFGNGTAPKRREDTVSFPMFLRDNPRFFLLMLGVALIFFFHSIQNNFLILVVENVGGGNAQMGIVGGILAVVELPAMLFFSHLTRHFSCRGMLRFSLVMFTVKGAATWLAFSVRTLMLSSLLQCFSYAVYTPASVAYAASNLPAKDMAKAQTGFTAAMTLGTILSSVAGGFLIDHMGIRAALAIGTAASFCGSLTALAATAHTDSTCLPEKRA
ncbi:MAG: MFS transporter [Lachnospiraceae bacterium]|nr:MFS transporter [Lachnospiraceae bacterium]